MSLSGSSEWELSSSFQDGNVCVKVYATYTCSAQRETQAGIEVCVLIFIYVSLQKEEKKCNNEWVGVKVK